MSSPFLLLKPRTLAQAKADIEEAKWRLRERDFDKRQDERWQNLCNSMRNPYAPFGSEE